MPRKKDFSEDELKINSIKEKEKGVEAWVPKTELGKLVKNGVITSLEEVRKQNLRIMEPEIIDVLIPDLMEKQVDLKKTAKVRRAGRKFSFRASVLIGDGNKYIGLGMAKDADRWPAVNKAVRKAKLNIVEVSKGCGSWECRCGANHSVPFKVEGDSASVKVTLIPAPKGTGLVAGNVVKDVLKFAGVRDVWVQTKGNTRSSLDFISATVNALANTRKMRKTEALTAEQKQGE